MDQIAVIFNPHAKKNAHDPKRCSRLAEILGDHGSVFETKELKALDNIADEIAGKTPPLIGICGGDGTIHLVLSALIPAYAKADLRLPPIILLKGGSMNTIRRSMGLHLTAEEALGSLMDIISNSKQIETIKMGTLKVQDKYGLFFGAGFATNLLEEYYNSKAKSGPGRATLILVKIVSSMISGGDFFKRLSQNFVAEVSVDGISLDFVSYLAVCASFIQQIGLGIKLHYRVQEQEGRFHVLATAIPTKRLLPQIHRVFAGKPIEGQPHFDEIAAEVVIIAKQPLCFTMDGELYDARQIEIGLGPTIDICRL